MANYSRFPFLVLPYTMKHMAIPKELMIDYDTGTAYVRSVDNMMDIPIGGALLKEHTDDINNPHQVTKEQVDLGLVNNYDVATLEDMVSGSNDKYVTPAMLRVYLQHIGIDPDGGGNIPQPTKYIATFEVEPSTAKVEVYYNNRWNGGLVHELGNGNYDYRVYLEEFVEGDPTYPVNITTIPLEAKVEVFYDGKWNEGKNHDLPDGEYNYRSYVGSWEG